MLIKKYPFSSLSIIVSIILFIPFVLKKLNKDFEPFPAVIFPSGSSKLKIKNKKIIINSQKLIVSSYPESKDSIIVTFDEFCKPIHATFCRQLAKDHFGLLKKNTTLDFIFFNKNLSSKIIYENKIITKKYISTRLENLGYKNGQLIFRKQKILFDPETKISHPIGKTKDKIINFK